MTRRAERVGGEPTHGTAGMGHTTGRPQAGCPEQHRDNDTKRMMTRSCVLSVVSPRHQKMQQHGRQQGDINEGAEDVHKDKNRTTKKARDMQVGEDEEKKRR